MDLHYGQGTTRKKSNSHDALLEDRRINMKSPKEIINIEWLEKIYQERITEIDGKDFISEDSMFKLIILEAYKMLSVLFEEREDKGGDRK